MHRFKGFDPLVFLEITNVPKSTRDQLSADLLMDIIFYIIIRAKKDLPFGKHPPTSDSVELFKYLESNVPEFSKKLKDYLTDFKYKFDQLRNYV